MAIDVPVCIQLPDIPDQLEITFPGGATLATIQDEVSKIPSLVSMPFNLLTQAGPVMADVKPIFDIIDTIKALFDCSKAVPDAISQLSPGPILNCIPTLAEKVDALLKLIPQLSVPLMIVGILDTVIAVIDGLITFLEQLGAQVSALARRIEAASEIGDNRLDEILFCADEDQQKSQTNATNALAPVGLLLEVVNIFLGLIGQPPIDLEGETDLPLEELIAPLRDVLNIIKSVRNAIPV